MSEPEGSALRPAGDRAAGGHDCTPEKDGPTPPAPELLPAGVGTGEDAVPELLDWRCIEDEDGAFGQLSACKIQVPDPASSGAQRTTERQISTALELRGDAEDLRSDAGGAGAFTAAAWLDMAGAGGLPADGHPDLKGSLQAVHLAFPEVPESTTRQGYSIDQQAMAANESGGDREGTKSGTLHGPAPNSAGLQGYTAGHTINGPQPAHTSASTQATDRGAQPVHAEGARLDPAGNGTLCGGARPINPSTTAPATEAGMDGHSKREVIEKLSQTWFVASELHRPEVLNEPIRGALRVRMSYCDAVRSRPSSARVNAQLNRSHPRAKTQWRPLLVAGKTGPPAPLLSMPWSRP